MLSANSVSSSIYFRRTFKLEYAAAILTFIKKNRNSLLDAFRISLIKFNLGKTSYMSIPVYRHCGIPGERMRRSTKLEIVID